MQAKNSRRNFLKKVSPTGMAAMTVPFSGIANQAGHLYHRYKEYFNIK